jgi:hypothetical protein
VAIMSFLAFTTDQSGAITVDWTVMAAAVVGLGVASVGAVRTGTQQMGANIESSLSTANLARLELTPYNFRAMTDDGPFWNSIPLRRDQMAGTNDETLEFYFWNNGLNNFDSAVARGYNAVCDNCHGAGNRLDLMKIIVDEMATRGLATQTHYDTLSDAESRYNARFGA